MTVDTKTVSGRRELTYQNYDELLADAERLAAVPCRTLGNWSYAPILTHLASALGSSIDGVPFSMPFPVQLFAKLALKSKFLSKTLPAGFKIPKNAEQQFSPPDSASVQEALESLRRAAGRCQQESNCARHPLFGKLTRQEWDQFSLRHAELHMSFVQSE